MNEIQRAKSELLYQLDDKPPFFKALLAALQHLLASFVGVITPTLIIGGVLGLGSEVPYLISMALMVSGVATFIQARKFGPVGSGLVALQGTSFAFLSVVMAAGFVAKAKGGGPDEILSMIFGVCFLGAFVEIFLSQFLDRLKVFINPLVTGIVIVVIGMSLIKVGMTDLAGGIVKGQHAPDFGSLENLALGGSVLLLIITLNQSKHPMLRAGAIFIGLMVGLLIAIFMGKVDFSKVGNADWFALPVPFKYGFSFDWQAFIPVAFMYLITAIESSGDLTATSMVSGEPITGKVYRERIKGGIMADGVNSLIASAFNTFPNTTYSQNNGVIQLTGIASRHVAYYIAALLVILGMFPVIGTVLQQIPKPVIGGATIVMFGTVAAAGIRILTTVDFNRRTMLILAVSFGLAMGVASVPEVLSNLPKLAQSILGSAITVSGLTAIILNLVLPANRNPDLYSKVS